MPQVTAWLCPHTDKLFLHRADYQAHLGRLARKRIKDRRQAARVAAFDAAVRDFQMSCCEFSDITDWVIRNSDFIFAHLPKDERARIVEMEFLNMRWNPRCSNYHHAPKGRPTNWGNYDKSLPTSYPGWQGTIRYRIESNVNGFNSRALERVGIHTGSGGSGDGIRYRYELMLFEQEFSNIAFRQRMDGEITSRGLRG